MERERDGGQSGPGEGGEQGHQGGKQRARRAEGGHPHQTPDGTAELLTKQIRRMGQTGRRERAQPEERGQRSSSLRAVMENRGYL